MHHVGQLNIYSLECIVAAPSEYIARKRRPAKIENRREVATHKRSALEAARIASAVATMIIRRAGVIEVLKSPRIGRKINDSLYAAIRAVTP